MSTASKSVGPILGALILFGAALGQAPAIPLREAQPLPSMPPLLRLAIAQGPRLRYSGTRVVEFRRGPDALRHEEFVIRDGPLVRVEFPSDSSYAGQVIVENGRERRHYLPATNEIRIEPPRREEAFRRLLSQIRGLGRDCHFSVGPGDVVARRRTRQVAIADKNGNVLQRLYIDPKTGAVLQLKLYDDVGTQRGFFTFKTIDYAPRIDPSLFRIERHGAIIVTPYDTLRQLCRSDGFKFVSLAPASGARLEFCRLQKIEGRSVLAQFYDTGRGHVSFFQVKAIVPANELRRFAHRQVRFVNWTVGDRSYVLFGPDEDLLERLAQPLKLQSQAP